MDAHLFPCLHCGGKADIHKYTGEVAYVRCTVCGMQTPFLKADEAIKRWNARATHRKKGSE